jgi:hypothetical protein
MDIFNLVYGIVLIPIGILLVAWYEKFKRKHGSGGFSFKIQAAGLGFVLLGLYIIATELTKII